MDASSDPSQNVWDEHNIGTVGNRPSRMQSEQYDAGTRLAFFTPLSSDTTVQTIMQAKGLAGIDWNYRDGVGRSILELQDCQQVSGTCTGMALNSYAGGVSPNLISTGVEDVLLGAQGPVPLTQVSNLPQITYANGVPSNPPQSTGGATLWYNTATHTLNIYDPVASGWYHLTLTSGSN